MQRHSTLDIISNNLFKNIERLGTRDSLSYGQLSNDTILTLIQSNNTLPLSVNSLFSRHGLNLTSSLQILIELHVRWLTKKSNNFCIQLKKKLVGSFIYLSDLFPSSQQLSNIYDLCGEYFHTWFDKNDLMISLISYNLCKSDILFGQTTKEYNELYIHLIEQNYKLITKTHAYVSCLFLIESHEVDLNLYDILLSLLKDDNLTQKMISISLETLLIVGQYGKNDIWRLYECSITIYTLLQQPNENTNSLNNEYVNEE
ncbi:unnamed protein product [Rotaria sp. Silwood1]|nr:unnamed protein product [Rotaria sp. Silwood1]CAF1677893.1 unnamed protein product [Rotaria sp. Silwood1]CAF3545805.1 unnamed protein product [Rotaria sp. Silwood1]CAF3611340.1 unnamed protein product [Rotaria sp. Silwood1]CAF3898348.1 unnamed protein product [Rotaria sp. Silwood1]